MIEVSKIIDGRKIADKGEEKLKDRIKGLDRPPRLDTIFAGDDEGSKVYLGVKNRGCERVGIDTRTHRFDEDVTKKELLQKIQELNEDDHVDGFLIQMPLPGELEAKNLIKKISPVKDVEGLHPINLGSLMIGDERTIPCTVKGILTMFEYEGIVLKGKEVCVVSHSTIVGKPMAVTLLNRNATVNVVHEYTEELSEHTTKADIIVTAAGVPHLINEDMIKEGAVVIDVGMNRLDDGSLVGDVDFDKVKDKASKITPVPGGVGPTTVLSLLENTYEAYLSRES
ncbi:MAG: bifunctional 5,10-methylenetetrahydrofolate dehydrogenase/5,10-methenyltetrahydrofolate cyclohydrolase [Candidatus Saliniplasma sp.]